MTDPTRRPRRELPLVQLLPNFLTVAALCAGLTAIRFAISGDFGIAAGLIVLSAVLDGLDGRLARLLKSESEIGAELDSLGDFVNFGVAPGIMLYLWALHEMPRAGWIVALIYICCCLLRLARFNVISRAPESEDSNHFQGVPSPAGALLAMLPLFFANVMDNTVSIPAALVAVWMVGVGLLMIGRFKTPSFKKTTVYADQAHWMVVAFVALVAALATYPWATLLMLDLAYAGMLLFTAFRKKSLT
ncbi:MAG: CDP-diacylglycerol--serine O-phosphatidyltransferase [Paracoccaceae bacterium]